MRGSSLNRHYFEPINTVPVPLDYLLREATPNDSHLIAVQRASMFFDMGTISQDQIAPLIAAFDPLIAQLLVHGEYVGWFVRDDDEIVAQGGVFLRDLLPGPGCLRLGRWAHIANVYTDPAHRRKGVARLLMAEILKWCTDHSMDQVTLMASAEGRSLYESLGFIGTADMKWAPTTT